MERKAGRASAEDKDTLRMAKVMKQNRMITTRRKNSNSGVTHPEKNKLHRLPTTERTNLRGTRLQKCESTLYRQPKEQASEVRKTNQPAATWKVFAMVRLLTDKFSG
jgi:hypothetical protein